MADVMSEMVTSDVGGETTVIPDNMKAEDARPVPVSLFRVDRKTSLGDEDAKIRPWLKVPAHDLTPDEESGSGTVLVKMEEFDEKLSTATNQPQLDGSPNLDVDTDDQLVNGTDSLGSSLGGGDDAANISLQCSDNEDNISSITDSVRDDMEEKSSTIGGNGSEESDDMGVIYSDKSISLEDLSASVGPTLLVNGTDIYYKCKLCFKVFSTEQRWKRHKQDTHFNPRLHACDVCGERFKRSTHLKRHRDRRHLPHTLNPIATTLSDKRRFACTQCPRVFERRNKLLAHIQQYHQNKRPFRCTDCNEGFKRQDHLNRHRESKAHKLRVILGTKSESVAIGLADDVINCPNLPKEMMQSFASYSTPKSGRSLMSDEIDTQSLKDSESVLSNSSLDRSQLEGSMVIEGNNINVTPVKFDPDIPFSITPPSEESELGKATPARLYRDANGSVNGSYIHVKDDKQTMFNEYLSDSMNDSGVLMNSLTISPSSAGNSIGQCPCYLCGKKFESEKRMKIHLRQTHSSERRHVCKLCGERFKRSTHLRRHMSSNKHLRLSQANGKLGSKSKSAFGPPKTMSTPGWQDEVDDGFMEATSDIETLSITQPSGTRAKQRKYLNGMSLANAYYDDYDDIPVSMVPRSLPRTMVSDDDYEDVTAPFRSTNQKEAGVIFSRDKDVDQTNDTGISSYLKKSTLRSLLQTNIAARNKLQLTTTTDIEMTSGLPNRDSIVASVPDSDNAALGNDVGSFPSGEDVVSLSDLDIKEYIIDRSHYRAVRPWECKLCQHGFTVRNNLVTHIKQVHTNIRPHRCHLCPEGFKRIQHLKKHRERIHGLDNADYLTISENTALEEVQKPVNRRKKSRPRKVSRNIEADIDKMNGDGMEDEDDENDEITNSYFVPYEEFLGFSPENVDGFEYINSVDNKDDPAIILLDTEQDDPLDPDYVDFAHDNTIVNSNNVECKICHKLFSTRPNLHTHIRQCHDNVRPFTCTFCREQFKRGTHLRIHISRKHNGASENSVAVLDGLIADESIIEDSEKGCITPPSNKVSLYPRPSQILQNSLRRIQPGVWKCTRCPKSFPRKDLFQHHMKMHVAAEKCACPFCDKTFLHEKSLKEHLKDHEDEPRFICSLCNVSFLLNSAYQSHMKIHREEDSKQVTDAAVAIGDITTEDGQLVSVILQTTSANDSEDSNSSGSQDVVPLKSQKVQQARNESDEATGDGQSGSREVIVTLEKACAVCNDEFDDMESLRAHTRGHRKPYCCQYCNKKYDNISYLERHTRVHTGSKPYRCSICQRGFPRKERAEDHIVKYH